MGWIPIPGVIRRPNRPRKAIKSALHILINACPWGRNRIKVLKSGVVFQIIELELVKPEKRVTELIFNLLANLCGCADGRDQLLKHGGGMHELSILLSSSSTLRNMKLNLQRRWFGQIKNS
ncbi:hypothetical protein ACFX1T_009248 [Malus domestica]